MPETGDKTKYIFYYTIITLSDMIRGGRGRESLEKNSPRQELTGLGRSVDPGEVLNYTD